MSHEVIAHRDQCLILQDQVSALIQNTAAVLDADGWATPTNCPPWNITMLVAHMTRGAESFTAVLQAGLAGDINFTSTPEERQRRQAELAAMPSAELLATFVTNQASFRELQQSIGEADLERYARHPWALQPLWWFSDQRLAELAFHAWDLHHSLSQEIDIAANVAQFLMPSIIERNVKAFHKPSPASYGHWLIQATDVENGSWMVDPDDGGVAIARTSREHDIAIQGDAAALLRWFYGRANIDALEAEGRITLTGARFRVVAWPEMFPAP